MTFPQHLYKRLEFEVDTRNAVNAKVNEASKGLGAAFESFIGCKVQLIDYTLTKKYTALADQALRDCGLFFKPGGKSPESAFNEGFMFWLDNSKYSLGLQVKATYSVPGSDVWHYVIGWASFGGVQDRILTEVRSSALKTDYSFQAVVDQINSLEALSQQVGKIRGEVREFTDFTGHVYF